jgi:hypothetical protein
MKWISIKDRLPDAGQIVIIVWRGHTQNTCYVYDKHIEQWSTYDGECTIGNNKNVTHWMPLPEPPKDES